MIRDLLGHLRRTGGTADRTNQMLPFADFLRLIGAPDLLAWERQCIDPNTPTAPGP